MTLFFSYASEDEILYAELEKHLILLQREGIIASWSKRKIAPGVDWVHETDNHLDAAALILLLISPDFMASDYCYGFEMTRALERASHGTTRVIPILLRPIDWTGAPFARLSCLPANGKAITSWSNTDEAFKTIAKEIRSVVETLQAETDAPQQGQDNDQDGNESHSLQIRSNGSFWRRNRWFLIASIAVLVALFFAFTTVYLLVNHSAPKDTPSTIIPAANTPSTQPVTTPVVQPTDTSTISATVVASPPASTANLSPTTKNHQFICLTDCDSKFSVVLNDLTVNTTSQTMNWDFTITDNGDLCSTMVGSLTLEAPTGDQLRANGGSFTTSNTINAGQTLPEEATFSSIPTQNVQYQIEFQMSCSDYTGNNHTGTYQVELFEY